MTTTSLFYLQISDNVLISAVYKLIVSISSPVEKSVDQEDAQITKCTKIFTRLSYLKTMQKSERRI